MSEMPASSVPAAGDRAHPAHGLSPLDRLLAEAVPTGTFGDARPVQPRGEVWRVQWTREEQDRHYAELAAAIGGRPLRAVEAA